MSTETTICPDLFDAPPEEPLSCFAAWLEAARAEGLDDPGAVTLATTSLEGCPATRTVQVLRSDEDGVVFSSHSTSRKGQHLAVTPWASVLAYWREWGRQVELAGEVEMMSPQECDELWAGRPHTTHAMSLESAQSERLEDEEELRDRAAALGRVDGPLPRPENWVGYRLRPSHVEFWQSSPDRLHRRLDFTWERGSWTTVRLQP